MTESEYDRLLRIRTTGRDDSHADLRHYPYEATPYPVLERLSLKGDLGKKNVLVDYGAGKGRVPFFLSWQCGLRAVGVEFDPTLYTRFSENLKTAVSARRVRAVLGNAETYTVPDEADRFFFFNPFSPEILLRVLSRIGESYERSERKLRLYFYYPSDEYIGILMRDPILTFSDEIGTGDLFSGKDERERILIFETG